MQRRVSWSRTYICLLGTLSVLAAILLVGCAAHTPNRSDSSLNNAGMLSGYNEPQQTTSELFQQWEDVLERHRTLSVHRGNDPDKESCGSSNLPTGQAGDCQLHRWKEFLAGLKEKPALEQIWEVNAHANQKAYRSDSENYGLNDYWATPKEFLYKGGDCEDYAIIKLLSLKQLGFSDDSMRIVVLVDTKLRTSHAVLAVYLNNDILILDNQLQEVVSQQELSHYVPIYSINEKGWWIYTSRENL